MHNLPSHVTRILMLGSTGQVAQALQQSCPTHMTIRAVPREELDLADVDALAVRFEDLVTTFKPEFVVNAAAYTAVDQAESDQETAIAVNALAPGILAMVLAQSNIPLLHYSTDYVFDGEQSKPYRECDLVNPLSVYGKSKLAGEHAILASDVKHLILRTSWVFSAQGGNFLKTMLRLASEHDTLQVVDDQIGSPTSATLIARVTFALIQQMVHADDADPRWGLYHLTASGSTSWYGYARYLIAKARAMGAPIKVADAAIAAVASTQFPSVAVRPKNSRLDTNLLQRSFGVELPEWQAGVDDVLETVLCES